MAKRVIEARVKQKKDTLANWNANPLPLLDGEQAFVVRGDGSGLNFKIGDGTKRFSDLPWFTIVVNGESLVVVDTIEDMRSLPTEIIEQLETGLLKGVQVNGYYAKGDTPASIIYYLSDTIAEDDGGSVIDVGDVKFEHKFINQVNVAYYGIFGNKATNREVTQRLIDKYSPLGVEIVFNGDEEYEYDKGGDSESYVGTQVFRTSYCLIIKDGTKINFNNAIIKYKENQYFSFLSSKNIITSDTETKNFSIRFLNVYANNDVTYDTVRYSPVVNLLNCSDFYTEGLSIQDCYDAAFRAIKCSNFKMLGKNYSNNTKGNGFYFGLYNANTDLFCRNAELGDFFSENTLQSPISSASSANPFIAVMEDVAVNSVRSNNTYMGVKIQNGSKRVSINSVIMHNDVGISVENTGFKIQGQNAGNVCQDVNVGSVSVSNAAIGGVYIQYSKNSNIKNYTGVNNGGNSRPDIWIEGENNVINVANVYDSSVASVLFRPNSLNNIIENLFIDKVSGGSIISDGGLKNTVRNIIINSLENVNKVVSIQDSASQSEISDVYIKSPTLSSYNIVDSASYQFVNGDFKLGSVVNQGSITINASTVEFSHPNMFNVTSTFNSANRIRNSIQVRQLSGSYVRLNVSAIVNGKITFTIAEGTFDNQVFEIKIGGLGLFSNSSFNNVSIDYGGVTLATPTVKGLVNQATASPDTATQASGATPTKAEFDALLAELRDVKTKLRTAGTLTP